MDAFIRVGPIIGPEDARRLRTAMIKVFGERDPEPNPDETVFFRSQPTIYSEWLREGLATTLLLFAVWSEVARLNLGKETGQEFANRMLRELPGLRSDARLLTSLKNELPLLAEGAPDPLLSALEQMLEGDGAAILPIFKELPGFLHPRSEHTGVLWALETLAWDPAYFRRAVLILARLAAIDPGGKLVNRPAHSLAEIFLLWNPNTNASSTQRLAALDEIVRTCPEVGWNLVVSLLPTTYGTSTPTAKPRLREAGAADRKPVTNRELWADQAIICERALSLAGNDTERWLRLVRRLASFPTENREHALASLDKTLELLDGARRKPLWAVLREEVSRHERFATAQWSLSGEELAPFKRLIERHAPADPVAALVALFDNWALDAAGDLTEGNQQRAKALRQLYDEVGADAVVHLATETRAPYPVIEAAHLAGFSAAELLNLLSVAFDENPQSGFTLGLLGLYRSVVGEPHASSWLRQLLDNGQAKPELIGGLFQAWPDSRETWRMVARFGREVVDAYWINRPPRSFQGSRWDLLWLNLMLLRYGRALEAIQSSLPRLQELPTKLVMQLLDGVIPELNTDKVSPSAMDSFYVEKLFEAMDERDDITDVDISKREFQFFSLLEHSGRKLRIYQVMARDPGLFHQLLRNVYLANEEEKSEAEPQATANARQSYHIVSSFNLLPGQKANGVDEAALSAWIDEFRHLGVQTGRPEITDSYVGRVLAHAPPDPDGFWPHRAVRSQLERLACDAIERALQIERLNMRGPHWRGVYDGGEQERDLANAAFDAAEALVAWPRTSAVMRAIGRTWEEEGKRADLDAAQRRMRS